MNAETLDLVNSDVARLLAYIDTMEVHALKKGDYLPILDQPSLQVPGLSVTVDASREGATRDYRITFRYDDSGTGWLRERTGKAEPLGEWREEQTY